ncbi:hypothetical protein BJX99DRAFT_256908 [Aspergillus californicus]
MSPTSTQNPERTPPDHAEVTAVQRHPPGSLVAQLEQALQKKAKLEEIIQVRQRILALQEREAQLETALGLKRRREDSSPPPERSKIEMPNVKKFNLEFKRRDRQAWLADVRRDFQGAPWDYDDDTRRILHALSLMEPICRARWDRHLNEQVDVLKHPRPEIESWSHFEEWTTSLTRDSLALSGATVVPSRFFQI